jgi:hypothetical protein
MTNPTLSCDQFADTLAEFLERGVSDATRAAMDAHAVACADCGPLLADLRKLRIDAANLPELVPSRELWTGIAARIETPVVEIGTGEHRVPNIPNISSIRSAGRRWLSTGLAAAALVVITAGVTYRLTTRAVASSRIAMATPAAAAPIVIHDTVIAAAVGTASPSVPASAAVTTRVPATAAVTTPAARLASNDLSPDRTYDAEIARLRTIVDKRHSTLDSATARVIDQNLLIIDAAIAQCRAALAKDPASRFLIQSLNDALGDKVQLLRTATMLPSAADY